MSDSKTMLIVDDSRVARMIIRGIVEDAKMAWEIVEAEHGAQALEKTKGHPVDIMTIDMNMPGIDGLELATQMRDRFPDAVISVVTANIQENVKKRVIDAGIGFISKPITEDKILNFINVEG